MKRERGTVRHWNETYGWILSDSGEYAFVHYARICSRGFRSLRVGERVEFTIRRMPSKCPEAEDVVKIG